MRKLLVLLLSLSAAVWADPGVDTTILTDVRAGATFHATIHPGVAPFTFHVNADRQANVVRSIDISQNGHVVQHLDCAMTEPPYRDAPWFKLVDVNFDGYQDIRLMSWWGVTGNKGYTWWLYNPSSRQFDLCDELGELSNVTPDPKTHRVSSHSVGGSAGRIYHNAQYVWERTTLVVVRAEDEVMSSDGVHFEHTVRALKNGEWRVTVHETIK